MNKEIKDLLLADLSHFGDSFWRNEEVGEKRINFYVGLVTAVMAGLVTLASSQFAGDNPGRALELAAAVLAGLFVLGLVTYLRICRRNEVTDQYKKTLKYLRNRFRELAQFEGEYDLPLGDKGRSLWDGGLVTMVAAINNLILAYLAAIIALHPSLGSKPLKRTIIAVALAGFAAGIFVHVLLYWLRKHKSNSNSQFFRASVGAVITNHEGEVLVFKRRDTPDAWQLPQGGLKKGEELREAVEREIQEETGICPQDLKLRDKHPHFLTYELPLEYRSKKTGRGQTQRWFLYRYKSDALIQLPKHGEFCDFKWIPMSELVDIAVSFRKDVYRKLKTYFDK